MCGICAQLNFCFQYCFPYLRLNKPTNWILLVPSWNSQSSALFLFLLPNTAIGREECSNMWHTYLEQVFIFSWRLMRVIIKIEVREITFGHAVITWNFFLIFYCCKIASFWPLKVRFEGKNKKIWQTTVIVQGNKTSKTTFNYDGTVVCHILLFFPLKTDL